MGRWKTFQSDMDLYEMVFYYYDKVIFGNINILHVFYSPCSVLVDLREKLFWLNINQLPFEEVKLAWFKVEKVVHSCLSEIWEKFSFLSISFSFQNIFGKEFKIKDNDDLDHLQWIHYFFFIIYQTFWGRRTINSYSQ